MIETLFSFSNVLTLQLLVGQTDRQTDGQTESHLPPLGEYFCSRYFDCFNLKVKRIKALSLRGSFNFLFRVYLCCPC